MNFIIYLIKQKYYKINLINNNKKMDLLLRFYDKELEK
jgi:hypothetical protein